jgi:threonine aldolase
MINLRSDTQTLPTLEMRAAMASAEVGDDTYREDPTVRALEDLGAERLGMEASLLVLSGTMANLVALMTHCRRGDEVFLDASAHVLINEAGGLGGIAGVVPTVVSSRRGHLDPAALSLAMREFRLQHPRPRLVWEENTHNRAGGTVLAAADTDEIVRVARDHALRIHVDGARLFNAAVALGVEPQRLLLGIDSAYVDLTKGLGCPLGALLAGSHEFIDEARRRRQELGGGMRQAGVIAACGLIALRTLVDRLAEDHERAARLARGLAGIEGFDVDDSQVDTNIVFAEVGAIGGAVRVATALADKGILVSSAPPNMIRLVTHMGVDDAAIADTIDGCGQVSRSLLRSANPWDSRAANVTRSER